MREKTAKAVTTNLGGQPWSLAMARTVLGRWPLLSRRWHYEPGVVLLAMYRLWQATGQQEYYAYVKHNVDAFVEPEGLIRTYRLEDYNLDQINEGKLLLPLYETSGDERYHQAALLLRKQLAGQPRTGEGGFWHKLIYPHQMWLDGIYMASPFYAEFAARLGRAEDGAPPALQAWQEFDDVARQILLVAQHTRDPQRGLFYHGWDESRSQQWADPHTGCSPCFWGRAMGWYAMAIPDVLDHFPADHPQHSRLVAVFRDLAAGILSVQDEASGVWYHILDQGGRPGNYLEASASCMFVYALAKGSRQGYLAPAALDAARRGYDGIVEQFVSVDEATQQVSLHGICSVGGLGGKPYRDGSFEYYVGEKVIANDYKGIGAFIMASLEIEDAAQPGAPRPGQEEV
jgi:unsaturated rhamnogalacturonyl hydrolase